MSGGVDEFDAAFGKVAPGEAEGDGEPPLAFLLQPVGLDPGQRTNQSRLAVIDMPDHGDGADLHPANARSTAIAIDATSPSWTVRMSSSRRSWLIRPTTEGSPERRRFARNSVEMPFADSDTA